MRRYGQSPLTYGLTVSNQVNISLDRRRVEQLSRLAEREGKKIAQWIEDRIMEAWPKAFPDEPLPGTVIKAEAGGIRLGLWENFKARGDYEEFPVLIVNPETALKIAFGLRGVAEKEVSNFKMALPNDDRHLHIRRRGTGVTLWVMKDGEMVSGGLWGSAPRMAVEVAECITKAVDNARRQQDPRWGEWGKS